MIKLTINETEIFVSEGTTVAAAILDHGTASFRRSVTGKQRGPLCGMGICFECRVSINGRKNQRSCTIVIEDGMVISTNS